MVFMEGGECGHFQGVAMKELERFLTDTRIHTCVAKKCIHFRDYHGRRETCSQKLIMIDGDGKCAHYEDPDN